MSFYGGIDGSRPLRPQPLERVGGAQEERRTTRSWLLGTGTLACPACDAPVAPAEAPMAPADGLACPVCDHAARVRDFLSLAAPPRPARVEVRLVVA